MNTTNPLQQSDLKPIDYWSKVGEVENALREFKDNHLFKMRLDKRHSLFWSNRFDKELHQLVISIMDEETGLFSYEPLIEADYYLSEKFYGMLQVFYDKYAEYLERPTRMLW